MKRKKLRRRIRVRVMGMRIRQGQVQLMRMEMSSFLIGQGEWIRCRIIRNWRKHFCWNRSSCWIINWKSWSWDMKIMIFKSALKNKNKKIWDLSSLIHPLKNSQLIWKKDSYTLMKRMTQFYFQLVLNNLFHSISALSIQFQSPTRVNGHI